jgi:hypothetical protein
MAFSFGDGFDCYAAPADAINGYWDSGIAGTITSVTGRFSGSQALNFSTGTTTNLSLVKSSGANEAVHHIVCSFWQSAALTGTTTGLSFQLQDGATVQCSVVFRSDGAILLTSGTPAGSVLATYTGAVTATSSWYAFEFEVTINNTTGSFTVRKNGNTTADFTATGLNTRGGTANNYANRLAVVMYAAVNAQRLDDLFWRSDASSVAWLGDLRCYTRMPTSDASVQFSRVPATNTQTPFAQVTTASVTNGTARYTPFTAAYDGTVGTATVSLSAGYTGNMKCSIFASSGSAPTTVLGSATVVTNPATGSNTITFGTPVTVAKGTQYWIGFDSDTTSGTWNVNNGTTGATSSTAYASFPVASPTITANANPVVCSLTITTSSNATVVNEAQQDTTTSYVYDSTVNDADFYNIGTIASTPASTIAVTTRAYMQKSDAGSRTAAVQIKSGSTTVASPTLTLTTSGWQWAWRMDLVDPNTSAAWGASAVNAATIGPKVVS